MYDTSLCSALGIPHFVAAASGFGVSPLLFAYDGHTDLGEKPL